jgi:hypothetical protein
MELEEELLRESWLYKRIQRRDSLVGELARGRSEGRSVVLGLPIEAPDSVRERLSTAVELHFADLGLESPALPLGIFVFSESQGSHPSLLSYRGGLRGVDEYFLSRDGEAPYCIIGAPYFGGTEYPVPSWRRDPIAAKVRYLAEVPANRRAHPNTLGLCRHLVRHGQPGAPMMSWLKKGATHFAERPFPVDHHLSYGRGPARGPFGKPGRRVGQLSPRTLHCLAGSRRDCLGLVLDFQVQPIRIGWRSLDIQEFLTDSPVDFLKGYPRVEDELLRVGSYLFFAIEEEFGPERFGEFWRSGLEPTEAFEAAFGEPLDLWVMRWLRTYLDPSPRGPGVPMQSTLFTLLTLGILAGGAVRMGRR